MEHRKENSREKKRKTIGKLSRGSLFFFSASFLTKSVVDIFESNQADRGWVHFTDAELFIHTTDRRTAEQEQPWQDTRRKSSRVRVTGLERTNSGVVPKKKKKKKQPPGKIRPLDHTMYVT